MEEDVTIRLRLTPGPRVEIFKDVDNDWRWRVKAANGEIVASGESYTRREDAIRGFEDAARAMADAADRRAAL